MRRAAKTDSTQAAIVEALRRVGAFVWVIGLPVDLLCGFRGETYLVECKSDLERVKKPRKGPLTALQREFMQNWSGGKVCVVSSPLEALEAIGAVPCAVSASYVPAFDTEAFRRTLELANKNPAEAG